MVSTPLGAVKLFVNDEEVEFTATKLNHSDPKYSEVSGRFLIPYDFKKDVKNQKIACCIPGLDVEGEIESGEKLEAISFYKHNVKLTIGVEAEFTDHPNYIDYSGDYLDNGVQYRTTKSTKDQRFKFGICWIQPFTDENEVQTWFGADPYLMP